MSELLLESVDTLLHHLIDLRVGTELLTCLKRDVMLTGILLQERIDRDDEGRYELTLVGDDCELVDIFVDKEFRLYHLRSNILAIAGLEEVFDTLLEEQLTILQITGITGLEITVLGKRCLREVLTVIVTRVIVGPFRRISPSSLILISIPSMG